MNSTGFEILSNPQPCAHIVYSYTDHTKLADAVCLFAISGIRKVEVVLLVLSETHYHPIRERMERQGFNLADLEATGHLVFENAGDVLGSFMSDGILDEHRFKTQIGQMIEKAKSGGGGRKNRPVRVFGEMVDLIRKAYPKATERLEELWNEVIELHSVPLLCAYSLSGAPDALASELEARHSQVIA